MITVRFLYYNWFGIIPDDYTEGNKNMIQAIVLLVFLIFLNSVFAGAEMAVLSMNEAKMKELAEEGDHRAQILIKLTEQPAHFMTAIRVTVTTAGFLQSAFAAEYFAQPMTEALAPNPQLLLLDEPFAAIDAKIRTELRSWLKDMIEKLGITSIFVTHDQDEAIEVADEIIITNRGRIEQKGTPLEVYQNPDTAFTAGFFGQTSVIDDYQVFNHFEEVPGGEKAIVRPEFVKVTKKNEEQKYKSSATEGIVERVAFRGSSLELKVRVGNTILSARRSLDEEPVREGEVVDVFVQRIFVTKGNEAVLLHNTAMIEDWLVI